MSINQKPKEFDGVKQDHGDAGTQVTRLSDDGRDWMRRGPVKKAAEMLQADLTDTDYRALSSAQRDKVADKLLGGVPYSTSTPTPEVSVDELDVDLSDEEDDTLHDHEPFPTEGQLGLDSKHDIKKAMARRVTLDPGEDDDHGDSDFNSHIRIRNRL